MANLYDFEAFIQRMIPLNYDQILESASSEVASVEQASFGVRGAPRQREAGSVEYASRIKAFLFYMRSGTKPATADAYEYSLYRPVVQALVDKKQFKPQALNDFN